MRGKDKGTGENVILSVEQREEKRCSTHMT